MFFFHFSIYYYEELIRGTLRRISHNFLSISVLSVLFLFSSYRFIMKYNEEPDTVFPENHLPDVELSSCSTVMSISSAQNEELCEQQMKFVKNGRSKFRLSNFFKIVCSIEYVKTLQICNFPLKTFYRLTLKFLYF